MMFLETYATGTYLIGKFHLNSNNKLYDIYHSLTYLGTHEIPQRTYRAGNCP